MAKQVILTGSAPNDKTGDKLRDAFNKINANFTELYNTSGVGGATVTVDTAPPDAPTEGSLWWNTEDGKLYINYNSSWIDTTSPSGSTTGDIGFDANEMYRLAGLTVNNSDLSHGATASVILPANGDGDIQLQSLYGGVSIGTGPNNAVTNTWTFNDAGTIQFPHGETLVSQTGQLYFHKDSAGQTGEIVLQAGGIGLQASTETVLNSIQISTSDVEIRTNDNLWMFGDNGTLTTPLLLPRSFTAVLDEAHMVNVTGLTDTPWEFVITFAVNPNGDVETQIGNGTPWPSNPGYANGKEFEYTEADHGIPGYTFTLGLTNLQNPGPMMWTTNLTASIPPTYPSTISSDGAIKLTSNNNDWILGTLGDTTFPTSGSVFLPNSLKITHDNTTSIFGKSSSITQTEEVPGGTVSTTLTQESQIEIEPSSVVIARRTTQVADDGITSTIDVAGTQLEISNSLASLKLYQEPDGPNNSAYYQVKATSGGAIVEAVQQTLGGDVTGRITVQETSVSVLVGDGVTDHTWTFRNDGVLQVPGPDFISWIYQDEVGLALQVDGYPFKFGKTGNITFPDGTVQSKAYQWTPAPTSSKGMSSHKQGMVAFDNSNFYYCKQDYTDGQADIWVKTAWTSTSW